MRMIRIRTIVLVLMGSLYVAKVSGVCIGKLEFLDDRQLLEIAVAYEKENRADRLGIDPNKIQLTVRESSVHRWKEQFYEKFFLFYISEAWFSYDIFNDDGQLNFWASIWIDSCGKVVENTAHSNNP